MLDPGAPGATLHPTAASGFARGAAAYVRGRPGYPADAVEHLVAALRIDRTSTVLDLAAGTGKLTAELVPRAGRVIAVEPVAAMRAQLSDAVPGARTVAATAEALPLRDARVRAVTVAQAFHWFRPDEALGEIHRVLEPGGGLALVWNRRDLDSPLQRALDAIIEPRSASLPGHRDHGWRADVDATALFTPLRRRTFAHRQILDAPGVIDRVLSISIIAAAADAERAEVAAEVEAALAGQPPPYALHHTCEVFTAMAVPAG